MALGNTMNEVYTMLKTLSIEQLLYARDIEAYMKFRNENMRELFRHQCNFTIEKKLTGKW